jgi:hypothetical protein
MEYFLRNKVWIGVLFGLAIPFVGLAVIQLLLESIDQWVLPEGRGIADAFRRRTLYLLALTLNIIPFRIFNRQRKIQLMRGMVISTAFYAILWIIQFFNH